MLALRWFLGVVAVMFGGGLSVLFIVANGFRGAFGASENNPLPLLAVLAALLTLLAGLLLPGNKTLLHLGALACIALAGFCVWMLYTEAATIMWLGLAYLALWLLYYWQAAYSASGGVNP